MTEGTNDLALDLTPPEGIYFTSFSEHYLDVGHFSHAIYFYQPDDNSEPIRVALHAEDWMGNPDYGSRFREVALISHPGEADETTLPLADAYAGNVYEIPNSRSGWYALTFVFSNGGPDRTLRYEADDAGGNPLKTRWVAPAGASVDVSATLVIDSSAYVYFKGGTFSNTSPSQYAYCDNVTLDGNLLYRQGFDQGLFNFPLGGLTPGSYTLDFEMRVGDSAPVNAWFGVNEASFDPNHDDPTKDPGVIKKKWGDVQFLYQGPMHTADYDAWSEGVACAQAPSLAVGVRPPPVRRGSDVIVACEDNALDTQDATLTIYPLESDVPLYGSDDPADAALFEKQHDYTGGYVVLGGSYAPRNREHWRVTIPDDTPVGRYVLEASTAGGTQTIARVVFYVLHDPYASVDAGTLSEAELATYAYDEDEDGLIWNLSSQGIDADADHLRDNFTMIVQVPNQDENGQPILLDEHSAWVTYTSSFRRPAERDYDYSVLDYAMASADGTATEFETMLRLYRFMNHRKKYADSNAALESAADLLGTSAESDPDEALSLSKVCSQPSYDSPASFTTGSTVCFNYARGLASLARSVGIAARAANVGSHAITEAHMPTLPLHGGNLENDPSSPPADSDHWYVFDVTDHPSNPERDMNLTLSDGELQRLPGFRDFTIPWESIAPRGQYCMTGKITGPFKSTPNMTHCLWVTTTNDWEVTPGVGVGSAGTLDGSMVNVLAPEYNAQNDYWITGADVSGWLGFASKDVYRIDKDTVNAEYIRVSVVPSSSSTNLVPKICFLPTPLRENGIINMRYRCHDAASIRRIPDGESYVVVFNDSNNLTRFHGDVAQYRIEVGDGAGWDTCDDGIQNGQETAVDCGGNCPGCDGGMPCNIALDCASYVCDPASNTCAVPACDDGIQNGDEANVDCGGSCDGCLENTTCTYDNDCASNYCERGSCAVPSGVVIPVRIEAENYVRYYDTTSGNTGGGCDTADDVDKEVTGDIVGGGCNVGWVAAGEWLEYDITVSSSQTFDITLRVASQLAGRSVRVEIDGTDVTGSLAVPQDDWQSYYDVVAENIPISAGDHVVRVFMITDYLNINYIDFAVSDSGPDCGDGVCDAAESCDSCPSDCGPCSGCTCASGCDAVVSASVPFTVDGAADACYFFNGSLGSYINSWNTEAVNLNGADITNIYLAQENYPEPIQGGYYLYFDGNFPWSHVEVQ